MTRIAYLVSDYHASSHTFVRREVAALRERGLEVALFSVKAGPADREDHVESLLGRALLDYPTALLWALFSRPRELLSAWTLSLRHHAPGLKAFIWSQFHFIEALVLARLLSRTRATRLHCHFANSGATVGMIAARLLRLPWSLTLHGISETDYPAGLLLPEKIRQADLVVCASFFMRAQAMRVVEPRHWGKMQIVRCGVDFRALPPVAQEPPGGCMKIVFVGRISAEKGHFGLLVALSGLAEEGEDFHLTAVGDGPAMQQTRARVSELGLDARVSFTGALNEADAMAQIAVADVFVLPSLMEGLPVVLVEAMSQGKAVVASRVAGIPELVEEGVNGLLFTPSDWSELQSRLRQALRDPPLRARLGRAGRNTVAARFRIEDAAERLEQLFVSAAEITRSSDRPQTVGTYSQ